MTIEGLIVEVGLIPGTFPHKSDIIQKLHSMEKYLGGIVKDYEENWVGLQEHPPAKKFDDLKNLNDFTGPHDETEFKARFSKPFYEVLGLVRQELLPFRNVQS